MSKCENIIIIIIIINNIIIGMADTRSASSRSMYVPPSLHPNHFAQVKAYSKPPPLVETVMAAVMTLMGRGSDWATAKKALGEANFLAQVLETSKLSEMGRKYISEMENPVCPC